MHTLTLGTQVSAIEKDNIRSDCAIVCNNTLVYTPVFGKNNEMKLSNCLTKTLKTYKYNDDYTYTYADTSFIIPPAIQCSASKTVCPLSNDSNCICSITNQSNVLCTFVNLVSTGSLYSADKYKPAMNYFEFAVTGQYKNSSGGYSNFKWLFQINYNTQTLRWYNPYSIWVDVNYTTTTGYSGKTITTNFMRKAGDSISMLFFRDFDSTSTTPNDTLFIMGSDNGNDWNAKLKLNDDNTMQGYISQKINEIEFDYNSYSDFISAHVSQYSVQPGLSLPW